MKTLLFTLLLVPLLSYAQGIRTEISDERILFTDNADTILFYQTASKSLNGEYTRSNYIHPLYNLQGEILTEDFPEDHPHHRGIFWAWHQLYIGAKRIGDGWEIKDFSWEVSDVETVLSFNESQSIKVHVLWQSPLWADKNGSQKPLVKETTTITVHPKAENYRAIDIEISLLGLEPKMRIGGSEDAKGYGGFSPRVKLPSDVVFTGPKGTVTPQNLPVEAPGWMNIYSETLGGITIFSHPQNPGYPNPWILRSKNSMQNAVYPHPGATPVSLSNTTPTVLKYQLLVHEGLEANVLNELFKNYCK